ncbi:MAG: hypothetical protein F4Y63_00100 [Chloroflexi bacterium]|nr:hypothetical protein [Chloroflexota bacterium]MYF78893.1 hypothetical protein [Chloroflexota bacterium]MYK61839.1 hypothetical protein [Chloroflexota bacterium]
MNIDPRRRDTDDENPDLPDHRRPPLRFYYSEFGFGVKKDNQWPRIGCGVLFLVIGVWLLLWIFGIVQLDPKYVWIPFAVVLVALGLRLLLTGRK